MVEDLEGRELFVGGNTWHTILLDRFRQLAGLPERGREILQRGGFSFAAARDGEPALFRLSILNGVEGEEAQVKLLLREGESRSLTDLGITAHQGLQIREVLANPGHVWVSGPGEEGLGSTLFGLLREIPDRGRAVTVEDEVFYRSADLLQLETLNLEPSGRAGVLRELKYLDFKRIVVCRVSPAQLGDLLTLALRKRSVLAATPGASLRETLIGIAARAHELPLYGLRLLVHQRLVLRLCPRCRE